MLLGLFACARPASEPTDPSGTPPGTTVVEHTGTPPIGNCGIGEDLKVRCPFSRDAPGPIALTLELPADGATLTFPGDEAALTGELVGWDVVAGEQVYASVTDRGTLVEGVLLEAPVPPAVDLTVTPEIDGPTALDHVVFPFSCTNDPQLVGIDARGRVRWAQALGEATQVVPSVEVTGRGTVLAIASREQVREWRWDGTPVQDLELTAGELPRLVHHASDSVADQSWLLDATSQPFPDGNAYIVDGVTRLDPDGTATHLWDVTAILDPQGLHSPPGPSYWYQFLGSIDGVHENSIDVLDDGSWILSFKHLDTIVKLDPDQQVVWSFAGVDDPLRLQDDLLTVLPSKQDPHFEDQHDVNVAPWGNLLLLDNGNGSQDTRVLEFAIDDAKRTAALVRSWDLGVSCSVQGTVRGLPDGSVFALCARSRELFELDDTGIRRQVRIDCASGSGTPAISRAYPTDLRE